jgi:Icc protein
MDKPLTESPPLQVVQLTDTHLFADAHQAMRGCVTAKTLEQVLQCLETLDPQPDLLLLTGDISQDETPASYQRLRRLVAPLKIPTYWTAGNHDHLPAMQAQLRGDPFSSETVIRQGGWQIVLLNSQIPGSTAGQLSQAVLEALRQELQLHAELPTLIALHHPPCSVNSSSMDALGLQNGSALYAVLDRYPQVRLVIFGHIHQAFTTTRRQVAYLGCPSTCVQFKPRSSPMEIDDQPPGFRRLWLYPDGQFETEVIRFGQVVG